MAEAGEKRQRTDDLEMREPVKIENAQQFYEYFTSGRNGALFVKPGDGAYPDLSSASMQAVLSRGLVIEKSEAVFGNVAPEFSTSVVRNQNKIVTINVGAASVPPNRFTNLSALETAKRKGCVYVVLCKDSYLAVPPYQLDGINVHIGTTTITLPEKGDGLGELKTAMGKCVTAFAQNLHAGQLKSLCEKATTVMNLAKTNMKFWTPELGAVLNASNKKELLTAVTAQRGAAKVSDSVLQFCALLLTVADADKNYEEFLEILTELDDVKMVMSSLTMFGKFPLPSFPKAKDKGLLFVDQQGTELEVRKLVDVKDSDTIVINDGAIVDEGQVFALLSAATTVYVKPPNAKIFFKAKGKGSKYEAKAWQSINAKPVKDLVKHLLANGLKPRDEGKPNTSGEAMPADGNDAD